MAEKIGTELVPGQALSVGTELVARYKGAEHSARVVEGRASSESPSRPLITVDGFPYGYRSLSEAARAVCGGTSVNGWRFWRLAAAGAAAPVKRGPGRPRKVREPVAADPGGNTAETCAGSVGDEPMPSGERLVCDTCGAAVTNYAEALEHAADAAHPFEVEQATARVGS
jgi:hypothetical protein